MSTGRRSNDYRGHSADAVKNAAERWRAAAEEAQRHPTETNKRRAAELWQAAYDEELAHSARTGYHAPGLRGAPKKFRAAPSPSTYKPQDGEAIIIERETGSRTGFSRSPLLTVVRSSPKAVMVVTGGQRPIAAWLALSALSDEGETLGKNKILHIAPWLVRKADERQQIVLGLAV